jgi:hypothetical protein
VGFQVLAGATMKSAVLLDVTPPSPIDVLRVSKEGTASIFRIEA